MSQSRIQDYGTPVVAASLKSLVSAFTGAQVLSGNSFLAAGANRLQVSPGTAVTDMGVIIEETEAKQIQVPITSNAVNYTVYYSHTDQDISGGVTAVLTLNSGLLTPSVVSGVILGYIKYPGGGVNLDPSMFVQPATATLGGQPLPTINSANWIVPIKGEGYIVTSSSGGTLAFTDVYDTSTSIPQMYVRIRNNTTTTGTVTLVFPFKVYDQKYSKLQMDIGVDVNASLNPSFIDSTGASNFLLQAAITGTPSLTNYILDLPVSAQQTPNTLTYLMFEIQASPNRQIIIQSLGLTSYNLPT